MPHGDTPAQFTLHTHAAANSLRSQPHSRLVRTKTTSCQDHVRTSCCAPCSLDQEAAPPDSQHRISRVHTDLGVGKITLGTSQGYKPCVPVGCRGGWGLASTTQLQPDHHSRQSRAGGAAPGLEVPLPSTLMAVGHNTAVHPQMHAHIHCSRSCKTSHPGVPRDTHCANPPGTHTAPRQTRLSWQ